MDEVDEAAKRLRGVLARHAERMATDPGVVRRATAEVGRRRRRRWRVAGSVAASVAVGAVVVLTSVLGPEDRGAEVADDGGGPSVGAVDRWRTELWHDLAVDVPADWGYGGAPFADGSVCFPSRMVEPDGSRTPGAREDGPYVGRPVALTDVCEKYPFIPGSRGEAPTAPYVWLGAGVEPGVVEYDNGYVQETVEVNGSTLTVAARDAALRERILATARGGETCLAEIEELGPIAHDVAEPGSRPEALRVCAYGVDGAGARTARLRYGAELGEQALRAYLDALEGAGPEKDQCPFLDYAEVEWVLLELVDRGGAVVRQDVVHLFGDCAGIDVDARQLGSLETVSLTPDMVEPWAVGGVPAAVYGPSGGKGAMLDSFIGAHG